MDNEQALVDLAAALDSSDPRLRETAAAEMGDLIEHALLDRLSIPRVTFQESISRLIQASLDESELRVQETMLSTLVDAAALPEAQSIDWSPIARAIGNLHPSLLEYALPILGFSRQANFRPTIAKYLNHADPVVRRVAEESLRELAPCHRDRR